MSHDGASDWWNRRLANEPLRAAVRAPALMGHSCLLVVSSTTGAAGNTCRVRRRHEIYRSTSASLRGRAPDDDDQMLATRAASEGGMLLLEDSPRLRAASPSFDRGMMCAGPRWQSETQNLERAPHANATCERFLNVFLSTTF